MKMTLSVQPAVTVKPTLGEVLEALFASKHTGTVLIMLHMAHGVARDVDVWEKTVDARAEKALDAGRDSCSA